MPAHAVDPVPRAYVRWRTPYPAALWARVDAWRSGRAELAVDLGAGTGLATRDLCARFAQVVAVDGDPAMVEEQPLPSSVEVRVQRAEEAHFVRESVDLVVFANALHWMDADAVLGNARGWLAPDGVVAAWRPLVPELQGRVQEVVQEELRTRWDRFRHPRLRGRDWTRRAVEAHEALEVVDEREITVEVDTDLDRLCGFLSTVSFVNAYARSTGDREGYLTAFWERLRAVGEGTSMRVAVTYELAIARGR
ncbi:MAG: class I SAM-dependent methyltransferase [Alphaproteobacteria bacterium]|nr:class I SAM-dependent methyltransferase [Alphaproteobacteria bacterium]